MSLTEKQIFDLNNMNRASQNARLGDILKENGGNGYVLTAATKSALGGVKQCKMIAEASGENVTKAEFKALLDALKAAGIMANE